MNDLIICDMGAEYKKRVIFCPICKVKRKAEVKIYYDEAIATCSKKHVLIST